MPQRRTRSSVPNKVAKTIRNKTSKNSLDVYAAASTEVKENRVPRHRLGEDLDDAPRNKRRRVEEDEDEESDGNQREKRRPRSMRPIANADDEVQYGSDSSGNEWTMGGLGDDDDSELDSDEAFGESDEERFEGFTFRGSSSGKGNSKRQKVNATSRNNKAIDLDETEEAAVDEDDSQDDAGEGLGDDAVDLAAMLDDDDEDVLGRDDHRGRELDEDRAIGDESDDSAQDDDDSESESGTNDDDDDDEEDDEAADEERVARMLDRLETLDSSRVRDTPATQPSATLTLEDLMSGIDTEHQKQFAGETSSRKKPTKSRLVSAPLPRRQQDRLDREVAAQKAKEQLDRWRDTVARNRRAEFLNFPVADPHVQSNTVGKEKFLTAEQDKPRTELEESIQRIMEESGLSSKPNVAEPQSFESEEAALLQSEELATNKLPLEEVMRRRADLRRARELLFREEIKAKRIAKIKSKSYRRVHRKEKERLALQEQQALHGLGGEEGLDAEDLEGADRRRAEARVATKHRGSKWAKALKATNRTVWDEDARNSVLEQAKRNEGLKRRIAGKEVLQDDEELLSSGSDEDYNDDADTLQQLASLPENGVGNEKGLAGLKFMRAAEERKRKANDEDVERLRKELAIEDGETEQLDSEDESNGLGRAVFGPQAAKRNALRPQIEQKLEFEAPEVSDDDADHFDRAHLTENSSSKARSFSNHHPKFVPNRSFTASGPLARAAQANGHQDDQHTSKSSTSEWLSKPEKAPKKRDKTNEGLDLALDIKISTTNSVGAKAQAGGDKANASVSRNYAAGSVDRKAESVSAEGDATSDADSAEPSDPVLSAQEQRESLQRRAFAGDDVELAFDAEKADVAESEDEKEVSTHLPGWGSWTGEGLSKSVRKANQRAKHNPLFKSKVDGVRRADRKDAKLKNVIISEKQERKGKKYLAPILPHGFETKAQYERSRRLPMGPEWSTKEVHQRMTRPRIVVKPGVRLEALERPMV